ncbi:glycine/D-amino acid oxidase-like deaminating enzyme [Allocatelliglobosispora scoriae]|uniref:Glycine/D-amino acid oxidase-like deaminating enzyme n=1 Tax=Allocatelliglobosispora scoriae TaxID=643052 RepID=A0A841BU19_9ACTN|nr:FAD-binding oxidoreductase [Allocatelliglobosispora scoriae]MBB5870270.1 glycine/D-amino acid oxidase-like deaminating enzyme [Allocatelliglobosispora scoriae]
MNAAKPTSSTATEGRSPIGGRPALTGDTTADVAIVGAGYTGLWSAYYLSRQRPDLRIIVIEKEHAGFGASGRNGGWCSALLPTPISTLARRHGRDAAIAMQRAMFATVAEVERVTVAEGIDCDLAVGGTLHLARTPTQLTRAVHEAAEAAEFGLADDVRLLSAAEASDRCSATGVLGATFSPHCAAIHPAKLVHGLAALVERLGVTIVEGTSALRLTAHQVITDRGTVTAGHVIRATEGYTHTIPGNRRELAPVYSLMVATPQLDAATWDRIGLRERETFADHRHLIIYGQRTADDRLVFGGRGAPYHFGSAIRPEFDTDARVAAKLRRTLGELFPVLGDVPITHAWGGPLGIARDWHAAVGRDPRRGFYHAGGYVGDGVATSNLAGRTLRDLILGVESELTALPWVGHRSPRWEPEPLRWIGINAALRLVSGADAEEARTGRPSRRAALTSRLLG